MAQQKIAPYISEYLSGREGYDMNWLGKPTDPRDGRIRRSKMGWIFLMGELIGERNNMEINPTIYTIGKNRPRCQHARCLCGGLQESQRDVVVLRRMGAQMAMR